MGLGNITPRYGYLASFGFVLLISYLIYRFFAQAIHKKYSLRGTIAVVTICILGVYYVQLLDQSHEWNAAGKITQNTLTIFRVDYEDISSNATIVFVNVPIKKGNAWVFPVGLVDGLWFIYRDDTIKVVQVGSVDEARNVPTVVDSKRYIFMFDNAGVVTEVKK